MDEAGKTVAGSLPNGKCKRLAIQHCARRVYVGNCKDGKSAASEQKASMERAQYNNGCYVIFVVTIRRRDGPPYKLHVIANGDARTSSVDVRKGISSTSGKWRKIIACQRWRAQCDGANAVDEEERCIEWTWSGPTTGNDIKSICKQTLSASEWEIIRYDYDSVRHAKANIMLMYLNRI